MGVVSPPRTFRTAATRRLLGGALPVAALVVASKLLAADAINSASLVLPRGVDDANPGNNSVTSTIPINALIVAKADSASNVNGLTGAAGVVNVLGNDTLNGQAATIGNVILAVAPGSTVPTGLVFDPASGSVDVAPGTPAGTYSFDYSVCEQGRPANCQTANVSVQVVPATIVAANDTPAPVNAGAGGINVLANDTLNGAQVSLATVTASVVTPATAINGGPVPALDPATGLISVPNGTPAGTYAIVYQICERLNPTNCVTGTATIVVQAPTSNLSGTVYVDANSNNALDTGEVRLPGWIVQLFKDGASVGTTTTDAQGNYQFTGLASAPGYEVRFINPENNVVFGKITDLTLNGGVTVVDQNQPIDPSGVIYDVVTRNPVAGATVNLVDSSGQPLPAACFLDPSQRGQVTGASGNYAFDIVPGAAVQCPVGKTIYRLTVTPPATYGFVSTVVAPQAGPLDPVAQPPVAGRTPAYPVVATDTAPTDANPVYYLTFRLGAGDPNVVHNHIPLDPFLTRTPLVVTKTSTKRSASTGDLVPYEITVRNTEAAPRAGVDVVDVLPAGLKFVPGSASANGVTAEPVAANGNRELVWRNQVIPANGSVKYTLTLVIGAGVTQGEVVNTGVAENGSTGTEISNRGTAVVAITPSTVFDCSELIGKVFEDTNRNGYQDEGEPGVPAARLATVNGQLVTTDQYGRYHIACAAVPDARIGSNFVLKVDPRSLPLGWLPTTDNPRSIRLTRGKMGELNFGVAPPPPQTGNRTEGE